MNFNNYMLYRRTFKDILIINIVLFFFLHLNLNTTTKTNT